MREWFFTTVGLVHLTPEAKTTVLWLIAAALLFGFGAGALWVRCRRECL